VISLGNTALWAHAFTQGVAASLDPFLHVVYWHYALVSDGHRVAKGSWIMTPAHFAYIDDIETMVAYRRRGFAEILMRHMLSDAAAAGAVGSILSATPMGKSLYQKLGYAEQAVVLAFVKHGGEAL
jgi:ribosomal protein S18 acetylase RimI-like enzyme